MRQQVKKGDHGNGDDGRYKCDAKQHGKASERKGLWTESAAALGKGGHELLEVYKTAASQNVLVGDVVRSVDLWSSDKMSYAKLLCKLKAYARHEKLGTKASNGNQAVNVGRVAGAERDEEDRGVAARTRDGVNGISAV